MNRQPSKRRVLPLRLVLLISAAALAAHQAAADDCGIADLLEQYATTEAAPEGGTCATYLDQQGGTGVSCHWAFSFRDAAAVRFADAVWAEIRMCREGESSTSDQQVNHPDSYDLREWSSAEKTFHVSVKDKGGENRTLVFVRYESPAR